MAPRTPTDQICTFRLAELYLGVNVENVREVLHEIEITTVPHARVAVEGLINLRGQIATAIDLRRRLQLPPRADDGRSTHVVVQTDGEPATLVVDEIGDVVDVESISYDLPPQTMTSVASHLIRGAYKLDGELLLLLDVAKVIDVHHEPPEGANR